MLHNTFLNMLLLRKYLLISPPPTHPPTHTHTAPIHTTMCRYYSKSVSYLSHFPCLDKKQCSLLQTALIGCCHHFRDTLLRFRAGVSWIKAHRFRFKPGADTSCPFGPHETEDELHVLCKCITYNHIRPNFLRRDGLRSGVPYHSVMEMALEIGEGGRVAWRVNGQWLLGMKNKSVENHCMTSRDNIVRVS